MTHLQSGYAAINQARLYYELAGAGAPFVMLHAGIADCRMWDAQFASFVQSHRVLRFDMRGYGKSLPLAGEFNIEDDLRALLEHLQIDSPMILMGCSIGAGLAIEYALARPEAVAALILVGGAPAGFEADVDGPAELFAQAEAAFQAGDLDRVAEIDMKIWFDGCGRSRAQVNQAARKRAREMARQVTAQEFKALGKHVRKPAPAPAAQRLGELAMPSLVIIGQYDLPYLLLAADYMQRHLPNATKATMAEAAHLPNMEHPEQFREIVENFLASH